MRHCAAVVFILISVASTGAQELVPLHSWRVHLSYNEVVDLDRMDSRIIAASKEGIFFYDTEDGNITTLTPMDGIHQSAISAIGYEPQNSSLFIGHTSGVIDIVTGNKVLHLLNLQNDHRQSKQIYDFHFFGQKAYIATAIGLLEYDLERKVFTATYDGLGKEGEDVEVYNVTVFEGYIFAATAEGVIAGSLTGANLNNFEEWDHFEELPDVRGSAVEVHDNQIYAALDNEGLYTWREDQWTLTGLLDGIQIKALSSDSEKLVITTANDIYIINEEELEEVNVGELTSPEFAFTYDNTLWIADNGLIAFNENVKMVIGPSGLQVPTSRMQVVDNSLFSFPGNMEDVEIGGFDAFSNGRWNNYSPQSSIDQLRIPNFPKAWDAVSFQDRLFISSYSEGLMVIDSNNKTVWDATAGNTPFENYAGATRITGLAITEEGLWIANYGASNPLHLYNGTNFQSFTLLYDFILDITVAPNGYLVMIIDPSLGGGILVFDPETGNQRRLDSREDHGELPSTRVNDIVFDTDGRLWVATASGIAYFNSAASLFSPVVSAVVPIFNNRSLFRGIEVTAIAIDGGGRKWMGTRDGVWLFNRDITEQIFYFHEENSPLLGNIIEDIMILQSTGEIFFATNGGLTSFRSGATAPRPPEEKVTVFPNPVHPDFNGVVGISGITGNASVKITDVSGNLIFQTKAYGSTALWNLLDSRGRRVATGVYLIFTAKEDGSEALVGKIAVVR